MVKIALQIKANLEGVTNLKPAYDDFNWGLKMRCANCGEQPDHYQYVNQLETRPMSAKGSRGEANFVSKCKLCGRENSLDIIKESLKSYNIDDSEQYKTLIAFDCRGLEPWDFDGGAGYSAEGAESGTQFKDISLKEGEWVEYDERAKQSVGVYELEFKFIKVKDL